MAHLIDKMCSMQTKDSDLDEYPYLVVALEEEEESRNLQQPPSVVQPQGYAPGSLISRSKMAPGLLTRFMWSPSSDGITRLSPAARIFFYGTNRLKVEMR